MWKFLDYCRNNIRDAIKLVNIRKIEIYHYELDTFQAILENDLIPGLRFCIKNRIAVHGGAEIQAFMESYMLSPLEIKKRKQNLFFSLMADLKNKSINEDTLEKVIDLILISSLNETPPPKHKSKALSQSSLSEAARIELQNVIENSNFNELPNWIRKFQNEIEIIASLKRTEVVHLDNSTYIRKHKADQNAHIFKRIDSQRERLRKYLSWPDKVLNVEDQNGFSTKALEQWDNYEALHYQILRNEMFVGAFSIHTLNWNERSFEFGYWVDENFEGQGLVTRSLQAMIQEVFSLGWQKAVITCETDNTRSHAIARKLGMIEKNSYERRGKTYSQYTIDHIDTSLG